MQLLNLIKIIMLNQSFCAIMSNVKTKNKPNEYNKLKPFRRILWTLL